MGLNVFSEDAASERDPTHPRWRPQACTPRSVYLHVPFCRHRCGYCNFSVVANRDYLVVRYLDAIEREIDALEGTFELDTLYLGGGTPSHLSPTHLMRLRKIIASRFSLTSSAELTAECNPGDLTESKIAALADFGVNRISLGVQSMDSAKLSLLERDHRRPEIALSIQLARQIASSVSVDLIFATQGESLAQWQTDLEKALELEPDHISAYELTYEKGTPFWNRKMHGEFSVADEDLRADMYLAAIEQIESAGLMQYETSSFAKPGHRSRHNSVYWSGQPYFAFGPGASSYIDGSRRTNHQSPLTYVQRIEMGSSPIAFAETLSPEDAARELLAIGLRRVEGVDLSEFYNRTGYSIEQLLSDRLRLWAENELLGVCNNVISLTRRGRLLGDRIAAEIIG